MRGLYGLKPWFSARLRAALDLAVRRGWSPDAITWSGLGIAVLAGAAVALGWWPAAVPLLIARLACANLDGALARARDVSTRWGSVLNEVGDRGSDLAILAGLAVLAARHSGWPSWPVLLVLLAGVAASLPTFASLAVAAAGGPRANGGPLGKVERSLLVAVAAAWPAAIGVVAILVIVGSLATCVLRLAAGRRALSAVAP